MNSIGAELSIVPAWLWTVFNVGIFILLLIDIKLFSQQSDKVNTRVALIESGVWIAIALVFNAWFAHVYGTELGIEFLTGYLVEKSLSVDNLFVILLIFGSFKVPMKHQHKVLFYGILGAIIMRALFIVLGAQLLHAFHWVLYIFGVILVITGIKFLRQGDEQLNAKENLSIHILKKFVPTTDQLHEGKFFARENGVRKATPLFLALVVIEATDLVFAVDSIPAVFSVTQDAFVAFASNILAVLGLRALYFVLADWVGKLRYLKPGLAVILGFIGTKMLIVNWFKIPSWVSLLVIFSVLATAGLSSWYVARLEAKRLKS